MIDLLLKNGLIVDGSGSKPYRSNLGINKNLITYIGPCENAKHVIDLEGKVLAPGFIDVHSHDDLVYFDDSDNLNKLLMGVTTTISGNCGESAYPATGKYQELIVDYFSMFRKNNMIKRFITTNEYFSQLKRANLGINNGGLIGHGTLRINAMGYSKKEPNSEELSRMKKLLEDAMISGAFGISTGLLYPPGMYSKTFELIELAKVVSRYGGIYATHLRHESDFLVDAVKEAIEIGAKSKAKVVLSHLKVMGKNNEGKSMQVIDLINKAKSQGISIYGDVYPYMSGSTYLPALLPPQILEEGFKKAINKIDEYISTGNLYNLELLSSKTTETWVSIIDTAGYDKIKVLSAPESKSAEGKSILEYANKIKLSPFETILELFKRNLSKCFIEMETNNKSDMVNFLKMKNVMVASDGLTFSKENFVHNRTTDTFIKLLKEFVLDKKILTLEQAIRKVSGLPSDVFSLNRGYIKQGYAADVVVFDINKLSLGKNMYKRGIEYIIVNGKLKFSKGKVLSGDVGQIIGGEKWRKKAN